MAGIWLESVFSAKPSARWGEQPRVLTGMGLPVLATLPSMGEEILGFNKPVLEAFCVGAVGVSVILRKGRVRNMIKHLRIDNRLIHGQVAINWMHSINADAIAVVNDDVAKDPIQRMALPLAAKGTTVYVFSHEDLKRFVAENPGKVLFVIARFPIDALRILEAGLQVDEVNVGNAAPIAGTRYVMVERRSIAATKEDAEVYRKIAALRGGQLMTQTVPIYEPQDFLALLEQAGL